MKKINVYTNYCCTIYYKYLFFQLRKCGSKNIDVVFDYKKKVFNDLKTRWR